MVACARFLLRQDLSAQSAREIRETFIWMAELFMTMTPNKNHSLPQRLADFKTLSEALDYAADGQTGINFYDGRCRLSVAMPYVILRRLAVATAQRLRALGLQRGDRVALIADTSPGFMEVFYGCQYGGFVPVPLPVSASLGNRGMYVSRLRGLLESCGASVLVSPADMLSLATEAAAGLPLAFIGSAGQLREQEPATQPLEATRPDEIAYLQYTSGSTRFPRGVMVSQRAVMANLQGIVGSAGLALRPGDRAASWLPFYHDMGLVGFVLGPMASQISVDYLSTQGFAMRPRQWLTLISENRATIAFAPPFGYELCSRRLRPGEAERFDLSCWRVAGTGAEPVRADVLERFADLLAPAGFDRKAFLPCYGLAEAALAVSFARRDVGVQTERIDRQQLELNGRAALCEEDKGSAVSTFVNCGRVLPGHELIIRNDAGQPLPEGQVGRITVRGPSLMRGYFNDPESTREVLSDDGVLDTGDLGYLRNGELYITGRRKDLLIVNGRNIWPQDLEQLVEAQPEIRSGDTITFLAPGQSEPQVVVQVECRITDNEQRQDLINRLTKLIFSDFGVRCHVELVPTHSLPRTSSGKRSRTEARQRFLQRQETTEAKMPVSVGQN